jgi:hypothetical protein
MLIVQILQEWKTCYGLSKLLKAHQLPHFFINFKVDIFDFVDPHKWLLEGVHFQPFKLHKIEGNKKVGQKVKKRQFS